MLISGRFRCFPTSCLDGDVQAVGGRNRNLPDDASGRDPTVQDLGYSLTTLSCERPLPALRPQLKQHPVDIHQVSMLAALLRVRGRDPNGPNPQGHL